MIPVEPIAGRWYAAEWTAHDRRTVLTDDPTTPVGRRVVAECDCPTTARLLAAAPAMLQALLLVEQGLPAADAVHAAVAAATGGQR